MNTSSLLSLLLSRLRLPVVVVFVSLSGWVCAESVTPANSDTTAFATFERPFSARSYWNSRPLGVTLGNFQIPDSSYLPLVGDGPYSSTAFLAQINDQPATIFGREGSAGLWELDGEQHVPSLTIPRWPQSVVPASGSDGHADIVDPIAGVIHSFLNLKRDERGRWTASMYAWTRLDGRGWADPAHYYQGARAAAVPPLAGMIRKHEVNDGKPMYLHALAVSLTYSGLSGQTGYVFPATAADATWKENTGKIPEGALLMLPNTFDTGQIKNKALRKVAETLKVYGAYVVDRNVGTPFYIYVENGAGFKLHKPRWDSAVADGLRLIQRELRQVVSVQGWVDGHGQVFQTDERLNMLSMRGPWVKTAGTGTARYDTWSQSVVVSGASRHSRFEHRNNRSLDSVTWGKMQPGKHYELRLQANENTLFELRVLAVGNKRVLYNSGWMKNNDTVNLQWPADAANTVLAVVKLDDQDNESTDAVVRAMLYPIDALITNPLTDVSGRNR